MPRITDSDQLSDRALLHPIRLLDKVLSPLFADRTFAYKQADAYLAKPRMTRDIFERILRDSLDYSDKVKDLMRQRADEKGLR